MKPIPERVEEIVAESYFKFVMTDPDEADAGAEWLKTEITLALTETDQQARESERERLGMGGMLMVGNYCGKAIMLAGGDAEMANRFIKEVLDPAIAILSNPPSQV